jgi:predicted Zn-dependent protease
MSIELLIENSTENRTRVESCDRIEAVFQRLAQTLASQVAAHEHFTLTLLGESSQFTRFNHSRVRQTGQVKDAQLRLSLMHESSSRQLRSCDSQVPFTGDWAVDWPVLQTALQVLQAELPHLPVDPYGVIPQGNATSHECYEGELLAISTIGEALLSQVQDTDFTGIYAGGLSFRGYADSAGQYHWFQTIGYTLDYSLFNDRGQAVKGYLAGQNWQDSAYRDKIAATIAQLEMMALPSKRIPRGHYRTYLAPAAVADLLMMFSWGGVSEADLQQGNSALGLLQRQERQLSRLFSLSENFQGSGVPRFNQWGEIAPMHLPIIQQGKLINSLVNSRSAKEYGKVTNFADLDEALRAPEVAPGKLRADDILAQIDTGLYLANLHYLNWSDHPNGRITGMTRYACFWVEQGEIVAPIENMRFDDSFYRFFGDTLIELTNFQEFIPNIDTYDRRHLGGIRVPGILVDDFTYTL